MISVRLCDGGTTPELVLSGFWSMQEKPFPNKQKDCFISVMCSIQTTGMVWSTVVRVVLYY